VARHVADQAEQNEPELASIEQPASTAATSFATFGERRDKMLEPAPAAEAAAHRMPFGMVVMMAVTATMMKSKTHDVTISYLSRS
jgi:hypothetical protein